MHRVSRTALGSLLIVAGVAMLVLPGPGILTIAAGLTVLGREYHWAAQLSARFRATVERWLPASMDGAKVG